MAPMAICHHLKILSSIPPVNESSLFFKNMQVLFTSTKKYSESKTLFDNAINEIAEDDADEQFHSKNSCTSHDRRIGEYCFCEALKLIWQNQKINVKKTASEKQESAFKQSFKYCVFALHTI
jgi:hypothetical protein